MAAVLHSLVDTSSEPYRSNRANSLALLEAHDEQVALACAGGGERYAARHRARGRLLVRERLELLLDRDASFLELSPLAAWGSPFHVGASIVTGVGVVSGVETLLIGHDPTVRGGTMNPFTLKKNLRALEIARLNRLPVVNLVESGGADLSTQADLFIPAGQIFHDLTQLSAMGIPTVALVFGNSTAGGAYVPGMCDYAVMVDQRAKVFLGGPPLVKMATGEESGDEELGGAAMHSRVSGLSDYFATDELDCIRIGRQIVADLHWKKLGPAPAASPDEPAEDPDELLGVVSADLRVPFDPREVIARVVDGSRFSEYKADVRDEPGDGLGLHSRVSRRHVGQRPRRAVHGGVQEGHRVHPVGQPDRHAAGVLAEHHRLHGGKGLRAGRNHQRRGQDDQCRDQQHGPPPDRHHGRGLRSRQLRDVRAGRTVPGFCSPGPTPKSPSWARPQLAGVMSIVARQSAESAGRPFDEEADGVQRQAVEDQIERESHSFFMTGKLYDDGIIDPRETRTVLGITLSAVHSNVVEGRRGFGVFRM